jgi:hypothetical protein
MSKHLRESIGDMFTFASWGLLALAPLTLIAMCVAWLNVGAWPEWTLIALGYLPPQTTMLGLNKLTFWVYSRQVAWLFLVAGFLVGWLMNGVFARKDD